MELSELLQQKRIENIERETFVSPTVLRHLVNKEFGALNKTQVLGVISILEKKYSVDLGELRKESLQYYNALEPEIGFLVAEPFVRKSNWLVRFIAIVLLGSTLYAGWYLFSAYYKAKMSGLSVEENKTVLDVILETKDTIFEQDNAVKESVENPNLVSDDKNTTANMTIEHNSTSSAESTPIEDVRDTQSQESGGFQKIVPLESVAALDTNVTEEQNSTAVQEPTEVNKSILSTIKRDKIVLLPQKMMWFELVDLDTKKVLKFNRGEQFDIDVKQKSWLFSAKGALFAFINNDIFEEYGGDGEVFFRLDQEGVHPLSAQQYNDARK